MEKTKVENFKAKFSESVDKNYLTVSKYLEYDLKHFIELSSIKNEILSCLMLELYQSSIFSTNHFLERIIKLALIKKYTIGFNYSEPKIYNERTEEAVKRYDSQKLYNSLLLAKNEKLITDDEYEILNELRDKVRNPYSHAETKKIIADAPPKFVGFMFNINDIKVKLKEGKPIDEGKKTEITTLSSTFSQMYQETFSRTLAIDYFDVVLKTLINLDGRIGILSEGGTK